MIRTAVKRVAECLGNTPAVCRRSYIDPRVIERFREGETINPTSSAGTRMTARARAKLEREVRRLISRASGLLRGLSLDAEASRKSRRAARSWTALRLGD